VNSRTSKTIPLFKVVMPPREALMPRLEQVLYSGQVSEGEQVAEFEQRFAHWLGVRDALSFYSGTAALHEALLLAGVQPGDEVVSTAMTAEPTNTAILQAGARIVWADVDPRNGNVSAESVLNSVTDRTKAIVVVHYGGIPAPLEGIRKIAEARGIPVIEDAAHALGAEYADRPIGTHSEYVMFSLQAIKHMTTVDGGILVVRDPERAAHGRLLRWFGIDRKAPRTNVEVSVLGYKYHMNNVNATIGLVQLDHVQETIRAYIENGNFFDRELSKIGGLEVARWESAAKPSYWFYTLLSDRRDDLSRWLTERGVGNGLVHKRNDLHPVFASSKKALPGLDAFWSQMLHIPCGPWVGTEERDYIVATLREGW
jgi:perosamine synthetase